MDLLRAAVSGKRRRLRLADGTSLDIAYVTPRLLAPGFPATSVEALYRNEFGAVARFLDARHGDGYLVVNLSERAYDYARFGYRVVDMGWPDHHTAPVSVLLDLCRAIDAWLAGGAERVVVVHCLAGKGRTGAACASFLVYSGAVAGAEPPIAISSRGPEARALRLLPAIRSHRCAPPADHAARTS